MFKKPYIFEFIAILGLGILPLLWYKPGHIALGHDMGFPLAPLDHFLDRIFSWTNRIGSFGSNQTDSLNGIFIHGIEGLLEFLGFSLLSVQQISFIFWFVLPGITMYILLRSLYPEREAFVVRILGSVFYMMNHYLLQAWVIAERTKFSLVAALPLIILILINVFHRKKSVLKYSILLSLILFFLNGGAGIPLWGGVFITGISFYLVLFISSKEGLFNKLKRSITFFGLTLFFCLMLNAYWLYPYVSSFQHNYSDRVNSSGGGEGAVSWSYEISKHASFSNLFRLQGIPDMYGNENHPYAHNILDNPWFIIISFLFPLILFTNYLFVKSKDKDRRMYMAGFFAILIISIPFVAGSHPPFGFIYDALLKYLPGFSIFRTPLYKFGMALWFAYSYLFAVGVYSLAQHRMILPGHKLLKSWILLIFSLVIVGIYNYPFFTGIFFNWTEKYSTMVKVPNYIFDVKNEIDSNKFSTRSVLLPGLNPDNKYETYNWKYFSLSTIPSILTRQAIVTNDAYHKGLEVNMLNSMYEQLQETGVSPVLGQVGANKIIIRKDFYPFDESDIEINNKLIQSVKENPLYEFEKSFGEWDFYKVKDQSVLPILSSPNKVHYISSKPESIEFALELPQNEFYQPFLYKNLDNRQNINDYLPYISQMTIQGICVNCTPEGALYSISPVVTRVPPGSRFYGLVKFLENREKEKITDPGRKIDYILGTMTKRLFIVFSKMKEEPKDPEVVNTVLEDWESSFEEIKNIYGSIDDQIVKEQNANKIYFYSRQFLVNSGRWKEIDSQENSYYQEELDSFISYLRQYILHSELALQRTKTNITQRKFVIDIPREGTYDLFVRPNASSQPNADLNLIVNNQQVELVTSESQGKWLRVSNIHLPQGNTSVIFPDQSVDFVPVLSKPDFKISAQNFEVNCMTIPIDNTNSGSTYKVKFNFESQARSYLDLSLKEEGKYEKESPGERGFISDFFMQDKGTSSYENVFSISEGTNRLILKFCVDPYDENITTMTIKGFTFEEIPYVPDMFVLSKDKDEGFNPVEFVSLNQTKYLVKFNNELDSAILHFNTRFDGNWKVREVDPTVANKFFAGESLYYDFALAREYEKQNRHMITDLSLPTNKNSQSKQTILSINTITNMWALENVKDKVFLLEYETQNNFYKASVISLIVFISLVIALFVINRHEK